MAADFSSASDFRVGFLLLLLLAAISFACLSLPAESILKKFLLWIKQDFGFWGPLVLAFAYISLSVLAVPASILTLGGGYLFGLPVGFVADSTGATLGATAAFLLGRTIGSSYVLSKLSDHPKFQAVAIAIQTSGFKLVCDSHWHRTIHAGIMDGNDAKYIFLVYVGTTVKDLSDVTHGWEEISTTHWAHMVLGFVTSVVLMVCIARVAKASLDKALVENTDKSILATTPTMLPIVAESPSDLHKLLILKIDSIREDQEKQLPI